MKKIYALIVLIVLSMSTASYGALSEDVYVRKDVFEVYMQNINNKFDVIIEELKAQRKEINDLTKAVSGLSERVTALSERLDGVNSTISGRIDGLDKRMDGLDKRIDDLRNGIYLWLVAVGLIAAWPKARELLQRLGKSSPSLTLEDVRRLIEENNAMLEKKFQA